MVAAYTSAAALRTVTLERALMPQAWRTLMHSKITWRFFPWGVGGGDKWGRGEVLANGVGRWGWGGG